MGSVGRQVQDYRAPSSFLRVVFAPPGFFIHDTRVSLVVNGHLVLDGSFKQGFDWWAAMPPGAHHVEARILAPLGLARSKSYALEVRPALTTIAVLEYSRTWGNFTGAPANVSFVPP
jgi:hypothetical protein